MRGYVLRWSLLVAALAACARGDDTWGAPERTRTPLPAARASVRDSIRWDDFAGAAACTTCHAEQSAAWARSTHGNAGGAPTPQRVIAPFDGTPIRFRDATVLPSSASGTYAFTVRRDGEPDVVLRVDGVIGGAHMRGGGTQAFVTRWSDGTLRLVPFDFSRQARTWFCNTESRGGHGWVPITDSLPLAACGDWPPRRVLGDTPRFDNCQSCHGSRIEVALDTASHAWRTRYASLAVDCESCHGPARAHVAAARAGRLASDEGAMRPLATLGKDASLEVCLACHAVKATLAPGHLPGAPLGRFYSARLALLGDSLLGPDGRTRTFAYQEGHLWSDCYVNGGMTCTSCHDPHTQGYRDAAGRPLTGPDDDRQCTSCHASKAVRAEAHTKHASTSPGARCVACHMPYLQEPLVGTRIPYGRADHTIAIPRPSSDAALGVPNTCARCHAGWSTARADAEVRRLWGESKPRPATVEALAAGRAPLDTGATHVAAQYAALAAWAERHAAVDTASLDGDALLRLRALARSRDVDVRALALATLHLLGGERAGVRAFLAERLTAESGDDGPLRARWALALATLGERLRGRGDARGAARAIERALEVRPGDARLLAALGEALGAAGDATSAAARYREALAHDPAQPLTLVNLGVALEAAGDAGGAAEAYQRALSLDAHEPLALANLGNAYLRAGQPEAAITLYRRALAADASIANVHFALAQALGQRGDLRGALASLRRGLTFDSSDAQVRALADELARRLGAR
ncbi:tetratricopeptide repeat protein [Gemmatirosa kalamazoonensis]|nr:tetratricopeptide repeat protein [Gemmatirosa kalamazoonensis]